jgi:glycosyltransferase involved in cell wall biosynthesis
MGDERPELACDVAFVGTYHYLKEWPYRKQLIDFLAKTYGSRFKLFGDVIENKDPGYPVMAFGKQLNDVYASAKVVVCDSLHSPMYWSNRIYETLGRGGFAIHPKVEGLEREFEYGKHFVPYDYGDFDGLKRKIDYYIEHDAERNRIRDAGMAYVRKHKTFVQRARQIVAVVEGKTIDPFKT